MIKLQRTLPKGVAEQDFSRADLIKKLKLTAASSRVPGAKQLQSADILIYHKIIDECDLYFYLSGYVVYSLKGAKNRTSVFYLPHYSYYLYENGIRIEQADWDSTPFLVAAIMIGSKRVEENIFSGADDRHAKFDEGNLYMDPGIKSTFELISVIDEARSRLTRKECLIFDNLCKYQKVTMTKRAKMLGIPRTTLISRINVIRKKLPLLRDYLQNS